MNLQGSRHRGCNVQRLFASCRHDDTWIIEALGGRQAVAGSPAPHPAAVSGGDATGCRPSTPRNGGSPCRHRHHRQPQAASSAARRRMSWPVALLVWLAVGRGSHGCEGCRCSPPDLTTHLPKSVGEIIRDSETFETVRGWVELRADAACRGLAGWR